MNVQINGEARDIAAETLDTMLAELGYGDAVVATALNGDFVPKGERGATRLSERDRIEIIAPMKGG